MFGFVTINRAELSDEEYARYRAFYCGQCHAIAARLGQLPRWALSHDTTFMALVHASLYEPPEVLQTSACAAHPFKKHSWVQGDYLNYAGDMTVALMYHKLRDDWADDHKLAARVGMQAFARAYGKVAESWPRQCAAIEQSLVRIAEIEADDDGNPDAAANVFGGALGALYAVHDDHWAGELYSLGAQLGRFVYMMDAHVDLETDLRRGAYNPFAGSTLSADERLQLLSGYMQQVVAVFERLPLVQDAHLLRNVLYSGVWGVANKEKKKER